MDLSNVKITLSPLAVGDILGPELVKGTSPTEKGNDLSSVNAK